VTAASNIAITVDSTNITNGSISGANIAPRYVLPDTSLIGTATIAAGQSQVTVFRTNVNATCLVFLTIGLTTDSVPAIKVRSVAPVGGSFVVGTADNSLAPSGGIPFKYMAIKP
jgi:hypothetical protein